jgi:IS5 family transposase
MRAALRALCSRVGRVHRDIACQLNKVSLPQPKALEDILARTGGILARQRKDKNKLYALYASEVECIAKGKASTAYEFGVKVSIVTIVTIVRILKEGFVVGARSMLGSP